MELTYTFELPEPNKIANLLAIPAVAYEATITVEFSVFGNYRPSTWDFAAEYPELEIESYTDLVIHFWEESTNTNFDVWVSTDRISTLIHFHGILDEHSDDLDNTCWEVYNDNQDPFRRLLETASRRINYLETEVRKVEKHNELYSEQLYFCREFIQAVKDESEKATKVKELKKFIEVTLENSYIEL